MKIDFLGRLSKPQKFQFSKTLGYIVTVYNKLVLSLLYLVTLPCSNNFFLPWVHIINFIDITAVHLVLPNMAKSLGQLLMQLSGNIKCLHSYHFCEVLEFQPWKVGEIHFIVTVKTFCILKQDSKHRQILNPTVLHIVTVVLIMDKRHSRLPIT